MKCNAHGKYNEKNIRQKYGRNADPRLIEVVENMDKMSIGLDDEFEFGCRACGNCCTNRTDILLNPKDIYNKENAEHTLELVNTVYENHKEDKNE